MKTHTPQERIEQNSIPEPNSGCWLWLGATKESRRGALYGRVTTGERYKGTRKYHAAHRYSYEAFIGPITDNRFVCHSCDNGLCVNPAHLWLGTNSENMQDAHRKKRLCGNGSKSHFTKLTEKQVLEIRASPEGAVKLGRRYGVGRIAVYKIRAGMSWAQLSTEPTP